MRRQEVVPNQRQLVIAIMKSKINGTVPKMSERFLNVIYKSKECYSRRLPMMRHWSGKALSGIPINRSTDLFQLNS